MPVRLFEDYHAAKKRLVPKRGLEPPRAYAHYPLKVACLPISPLRQGSGILHRGIAKSIGDQTVSELGNLAMVLRLRNGQIRQFQVFRG